MQWHEKIINAHTAVTDHVSHGHRMKSDRYFVWQEENTSSLMANNRHVETAMTGTTDLFTRMEFDPWAKAFEEQLDADGSIVWGLNSIQYEENTGYWHYEWVWTVS